MLQLLSSALRSLLWRSSGAGGAWCSASAEWMHQGQCCLQGVIVMRDHNGAHPGEWVHILRIFNPSGL